MCRKRDPYGGYAKSQAQKMKQLNSNGSARSELVKKYGYDTKFYMHTVRLLEMAIEILTYGLLTVKRKDYARLLSLREGIHTLDDALDHIESLEQRLKIAYEESTLPEQPNFELINNWLVDFNMRVAKSY
ncbi:nucleotidyltransferase domain-containing protein [Lysinibacillus sphaericus]|nr:nucleotidyltransferase domain-containing protein [Lysinibacillus sphaericus]